MEVINQIRELMRQRDAALQQQWSQLVTAVADGQPVDVGAAADLLERIHTDPTALGIAAQKFQEQRHLQRNAEIKRLMGNVSMCRRTSAQMRDENRIPEAERAEAKLAEWTQQLAALGVAVPDEEPSTPSTGWARVGN